MCDGLVHQSEKILNILAYVRPLESSSSWRSLRFSFEVQEESLDLWDHCLGTEPKRGEPIEKNKHISKCVKYIKSGS